MQVSIFPIYFRTNVLAKHNSYRQLIILPVITTHLLTIHIPILRETISGNLKTYFRDYKTIWINYMQKDRDLKPLGKVYNVNKHEYFWEFLFKNVEHFPPSNLVHSDVFVSFYTITNQI